MKVASSVRGLSAHGVLGASEKIISSGGFLASLSGAIDSIQYFIAYGRTSKQGDSKSSGAYFTAGLVATGSAIVLVARAAGFAFFMYPLALGLTLLLAAHAIYLYAKKNESTPLEKWLRKSIWGLPEKNRYWDSAKYMDDAVSELNSVIIGASAYLLISSSVAHNTYDGPMLSIGGGFSRTPKTLLMYEVSLPQFRRKAAHYKWAIYAVGKNSGKRSIVLESDEHRDSEYERRLSAGMGENENEHREILEDADAGRRKISGWVNIASHDGMHSVDMEVHYWIEKSMGARPLIIKYRMSVIEE